MNYDPTLSPIDFTRLSQTSNGDLEFEREVLDLYLNDTRGRLDRIQNALDAKNADEVRRLAHTIKGASASVGAIQLNALAAQLEEQAIQANLNQGPATLAMLEEAHAAATKTIDHHLPAKIQAEIQAKP